VAPLLQDVFWEGAIARRVSQSLRTGALLHVASSMPIRDLDAFAGSGTTDIQVHASRGCNGIDGTLATAYGEAIASRHTSATVLLGDLAFVHDMNGAYVAARGTQSRDLALHAVVINNSGGGIFELLPIRANEPSFERLFATPQSLDVATFCRAVGASHQPVRSLGELDAALATPTSGFTVTETLVDRAQSVRCRQLAWERANKALLQPDSEWRTHARRLHAHGGLPGHHLQQGRGDRAHRHQPTGGA